MAAPSLYTIGHSTRPFGEFVGLLKRYGVQCLVDVRQYPGSRHSPQYNKEALREALERRGIRYRHIVELGGRRRARSPLDTSLRSTSFAAYAAYMRTAGFTRGLRALKRLATKQTVAIMCAEKLWWRCHRRMISDRLTLDGWVVRHLGAGAGPPVVHEVWPVARLSRNGKIVYDG
jgi:uncharacterized protein (DUF488 family)